MRRFLIPPIILVVIAGAVLGYLLIYVPPFAGDPPEVSVYHNRIIVFLLSMFLFLTSLMAVVLYFIYRFLGDYMEPRYTYRRSLRQGALVGLGVVIVAVLLLTRTANVVTVVLTVGVIASLEFALRSG